MTTQSTRFKEFVISAFSVDGKWLDISTHGAQRNRTAIGRSGCESVYANTLTGKGTDRKDRRIAYFRTYRVGVAAPTEIVITPWGLQCGVKVEDLLRKADGSFVVARKETFEGN